MKHKNTLVVKHNSLINAKGKHRYTRNELKLVCNLVSNVTKYDGDFEVKRIPLRDLGFIDSNTHNYTNYMKTFEELLSKPFKIPGRNGYINWFSHIEIVDGFIEYNFDPKLKQFLLDLKSNFTKYKLNNILNLGSSYSIHIYELLAQTKDMGGRTIYIDDFREVLNIPASYKNNNIKVLLEKVQEDLEKNTDIKFIFGFEKESRKFNKINFKIIHNKNSFRKDNVQKQEEEREEHLESLREPDRELFLNKEIDKEDILTEKDSSSLKLNMKNLRL